MGLRIEELSDGERMVWEAFPRGETVDFRDASVLAGTSAGVQVVRAEVVAALLLGEREADADRVPAVQLWGAQITGRLDLAFADVRHAILLRECVFDQEPRLYGASTRLVNLSQSRLPGLQLSDARVDGLLLLEECHFTGPVRLTGARIAQTLSLKGADLRGDPALMAGGLSVGRNLACSGMSVTGECRLPNASISGTLLLDGASLKCPGGVALMADGLIADRGVSCTDGFSAEGEVVLQDARIGRQVTFLGGNLSNPAGRALNAERLNLDGALFLDKGFTADGQVMLRGATVRGALYLGGELTTSSGSDLAALNGNRATIDGGIFATPGLKIHGELALGSASVRGSLDLRGTHLDNPGGTALTADRTEVTGRFFCGDGFTAAGEISLIDARIGGGLYFTGAKLSNVDEPALRAWGLAVTGVVNCCDGFTANGAVSFVGARLNSELSFTGGTVNGNVNIRRLQAAVLRADSQTVVDGVMDLRYATVQVLQDDPAGWPRAAYHNGFTYTTLVSPAAVTDRLRLIKRDPDGYHPQPYEQLAAVYRSMGNDADARTILLEKQRARRQTITAPLRAWGLVQDWMVGYGYRPLRAALWLGALLVIGTIAFALHHPAPLDAGQAPEFSPFLYTLDLLVPIVGFGQKGAFNATGWQQWLAAALIAAGWVLATTIAAGVTRVLSRQ